MKQAGIVLLLALAALTAVWRGESWMREARWRMPHEAGAKALDAERYSDAEKEYRTAVDVARGFGDKDNRLGMSLHGLAVVYGNQGRHAESVPLYREALQICKQAQGPGHPDVATCLSGLASAYGKRAMNAQAEPLLEEALAIREKALGPLHPEFARSLNDLAWMRSNQGRYADAEDLARRGLTIREKALGPDHLDVAYNLNDLSWFLIVQDRLVEAGHLLERSLPILESKVGPEHQSFRGTRSQKGRTC
jgi:tetratricopeptide (TPR) repeat protein